MEAQFEPDAAEAVHRIYSDPSQEQLADRLEEVLDLLDSNPGHERLRRSRMQVPKLWVIPVHGSGRDLVILWDLTDDGRPTVHYVGNAF